MRIRDFLRTTSVYAFSEIGGRVANILVLPIIARLLGPTEFGAGEFALAVLGVGALLSSMDLEQSLLRFVAPAGESNEVRRFSSTILWGVLFLSLVFCGGVAISEFFLPSGYKFSVWFPRPELLWLTLFCLPFFQLRVETGSIARALQKPGLYSVIAFLHLLGAPLLTLTLVVLGDKTSRSVMWGQFGGLALGGIIGVVVFRKLLFPPSIERKASITSLRFSVPLLPMDLTLWTMTFFDRIALAQWGTPVDLGLYALAARAIFPLQMLGTVFHRAWLPFAYANAGDQSNIESSISDLFYRAQFSLVLVLSLFSPEIIRLLGGQQYAGGAVVFPILALSASLSSAVRVLATPLLKKLAPGALSASVAVSSVINVVLNAILVPKIGILGAGISGLVGWIIGFGLIYHRLYRLGTGTISWRVLATLIFVAGLSLVTPVLIAINVGFAMRILAGLFSGGFGFFLLWIPYKAKFRGLAGRLRLLIGRG